MSSGNLEVGCVEYHTAGEPFRILTGGFPPIPGATILHKRRFAAEHLDHYRRLVINEPRGHNDMYGCFVTEPVSSESLFGVLFFHNAGFSTACGHGTIALATWAIESGLVAWDGASEIELPIDVPSGTVVARCRPKDGAIEVTFRNVPAYVHSTGHLVATPAGRVTADVAYGGAFYASVDLAQLGLSVTPRNTTTLIGLGKAIKRELEARAEFADRHDPEISGIYGAILFERLATDGRVWEQRNVTVFADGEVDRSPCGSGTSARLALLVGEGFDHASVLRHRSIIDTEFTGRVVGLRQDGDLQLVETEVTGTAHLAAHHVFVRRAGDPLPDGFRLA